MAFSSYIYILAFLPITCLMFWSLQRRSVSLALWALVAASALFYVYWDPRDILVAGASFAGNYFAAGWILKSSRGKLALSISVAANLLALGYFKYASFILGLFDPALGSRIRIGLPLGISFFTFTQIAYLADCYAGRVRPDQHRWRDYLTFVSFFPHLIAGPILHHANLIPQLNGEFRRQRGRKIATGLVLFSIGLFKKIIIADQLGLIANPLFDAADRGVSLGAEHAWAGAIAYALQIYFDFSGYSDMAVASALFVGIRIPFNFNSPYKAASVIDFWRRWHITLSTFLRGYLYIPLGGNRRGPGRRYLNVFATMLLGGIWHGAGVNFVIWGALHGLFIVTNHLWRDLAAPRLQALVRSPAWAPAAYVLTMACVLFAWIFFRARTSHGAFTILGQMLTPGGAAGASLTLRSLLLLSAAGLLAGLAPNTWRIHDWILADQSRRAGWVGAVAGGLFAIAFVAISADSPFLYFQF
jgi:D-alanyl-lipoteichoic acid acyltransferase DltB (MBOAT superfamily)